MRGIITAVAAIATTGAVFWVTKSELRVPDVPIRLLVVFILWVVVPPLWFLVDWALFEPTNDKNFEHFKYSQELARNLWVAVAAVLALILGLRL